MVISPLLTSITLPYDTKKAGKEVKHYLSRFDEKEQYEGIAVGAMYCIEAERADIGRQK